MYVPPFNLAISIVRKAKSLHGSIIDAISSYTSSAHEGNVRPFNFYFDAKQIKPRCDGKIN